MVKKIMITLLLITITIGMSSCMLKFLFKRRLSGEEKLRIVHEYLKEKYDEEFDHAGTGGMDWTLDTLKYFMRPKNGSKEDLFAVWFSPNDDGSYHISDGYFAVLIQDEYEKLMSSYAI